MVETWLGTLMNMAQHWCGFNLKAFSDSSSERASKRAAWPVSKVELALMTPASV